LWGLSKADRLLLLEAGFWLGVSSLAIAILPFRWIKLGWGDPKGISKARPGPQWSFPQLLEQVSWAVATASRYLPWDCLCLAQAMAGKAMLTRRGIPSTVYLGLAKNGAAPLRGHAWLTCGGQVLTGKQGLEEYSVIATLAGDADSGP
jgi:hypothetical protein